MREMGTDAGNRRPVRWGYDADNGPAAWASLDPGFAACALGGEQSPVDLTGGRGADLRPLEFAYRKTRIVLENTGHTVQANPDPGSFVVLDGTRYDLRQFHFHHRSEHLFDGVRLALDLHLVHATGDGALAVVGILFEEGTMHAALAPLWAHLPAEPGASRALPGEFDIAALLPARGTAWRYRGSLTTPPCTEGVAWAVLAEPLAMSAGQIAAFAALYPNNCRPVQPLGERVLRIG
ncbi:MAG: carbonic anhydrase family protein [Defluviicoccus sp.]|nr:carbonic anhydrase family protein [Defluviicoccus sp.]